MREALPVAAKARGGPAGFALLLRRVVPNPSMSVIKDSSWRL